MVLPHLRLDDLLLELQGRLEAARATRDRVHSLLEAVVSIGGELELAAVLRRIIEAATKLADARYGALGVISEEGERLVEFITVGVTDEEIEAIGHWPHGHGILGLLIKEPHGLRLPDLAGHPESYGFPANHPPMRRFLGVPIRIRDEVFGNLYLTEKSDGGEFDEDDEIVVTALATAAGVAIENARLYEQTRRRERWLEASAEISTALLSGTDPQQVSELVIKRTREIADGSLAVLAVADGPDEDLVIVAADGAGADEIRGRRVPIESTASALVYRSGVPRRLDDGSAEAAGADLPASVDIGPLLIVPLGSGTRARGVISVTRAPGAVPFGTATQRLLEAFAAQAEIALELAERRRDAERLGLLEDRDRIAKDLHDTVIQRLFATAMMLMSAIKITEKREVAVRVQGAVDDLDDTIRQIRSSIFALQTSSSEAEHTLRGRLHQVIDKAAEGLGFAPSVRLDGLLDTRVSDTTGRHLLAVVQEALSNITRHAEARRASVAIEVADDLTLRIDDDGIGIPSGGRRSGLANMEARAAELGGTFTAGAREGGGTVLVWQVPV
ncbi:GAF domain-containing protein [Spirillospora sp. NPDC047279]|uniref:sensor histidine kinase n=1 Tax=Spirillospora sp. NPDC047279 TaxID=3155478 RepID=UPI0033EFA1EC